MNKIAKNAVFTIIAIALLVCWNVIYKTYISPGVGWLPDKSFLIIYAIREDVVSRWLPFIIVSCFYVGFKKFKLEIKREYIIISVLFILVVQLGFALIHIPFDSVKREMLYDLGPNPTFKEFLDAFCLQGILGIVLSIVYYIYIPKNNPLSSLQILSLIMSCFVHVTYNYVLLLVY